MGSAQVLDSPFRADDFSFTHGHAQLAVLMADRDGDGRLSYCEVRTILDGTYKQCLNLHTDNA
jgi:hypothetical protein